jgi:mRNA interferase MazF
MSTDTGLVMPLLRGDVYEVNLDPKVGAEIGKRRPAVIIQNDIGNANSGITIIAPISSIKQDTRIFPVMVVLKKGSGGLSSDSFVHCGQIRALDKKLRLANKLGHLSDQQMEEIEMALKISLDLP